MGSSIPLESAMKEVLTAAVEGWTGIHEIIWALNNDFPEAGLGEKYRVAEVAVKKCLQEQWIGLYRGPAWNEDGEYVLLHNTEALRVIANPTSWYIDHDGESFAISVTDAGRSRWSSGEFGV